MSKLAALIADLRRAQYKPPETRGDCLAGTERTGSAEERRAGVVRCGALLCRHNLDRVDSQDVPGRRHAGLAPPWTLNGGNPCASSPSCALDVADAGPHSSAQVAAILGLDKRRVEQIVARVLRSAGAVELARLQSALEEG